MKIIILALIAAVYLFQGTWAKPRTSLGKLHHSNRKTPQDISEKVFEQANDACKCSADVFEHPNCQGRRLTIRQQNADFGNDFFHDRVDSMEIRGKCRWIFYHHCNFLGSARLVSSGRYSSAPKWKGEANTISSARALPPQGTVAIVLFEHSNYQGRMVVLTASNDHLPSIEFDDTISSIIVTGGMWKIFEHPGYTGKPVTLSVGDYPNIHKSHPLKGDTISSVRMVGDRLQIMEELLEEPLDDEELYNDY